MHRTAPRLTRILVCAAVPVLLAVSGCSSESGDSSGKDAKDTKDSQSSGGSGDSGGSGGPAPEEKKPEPVAAAKFPKLPSACTSITSGTIGDLVPGVKSKKGTAGKTSDALARANCAWNGLDDKGVKGSQYRWLDVSLVRYDSEQALGLSGEQRAADAYAKEVAKTQATAGARNKRESPAAGVGQEARAIGYELKKTGEDFTYATIVTRTENVVITLTLNGTGYSGAKPPTATSLMEGSVKAAKEAVASVASANK
ncbi:DUF3558 domain-containing protein [Streptomyces sp. NPDC057638]|uniref:DUF3558 domain-containing protein n=1 Tax=Streptomyces sp. NPDC057638 TaxID=3346190 RepID=UPI0036B93013